MLLGASGCGGFGGFAEPYPPAPLATPEVIGRDPFGPQGQGFPVGSAGRDSTGTDAAQLALVPSAGMRPLPDAPLPGIGPVGAVVIPVSLGPRAPAHDERWIVENVIGSAASAMLDSLSRGALRIQFEVLPPLIDPSPTMGPLTPAELTDIAQRALREWTARGELARFDNDGPDGLPRSGDDDGRLDLVILLLEAEVPAPLRWLPGFTFDSRVGRVRSGRIGVLTIARSQAAGTTDAVALVLDALGTGNSERACRPASACRLGTLARVRLGWLPVHTAATPGAWPLREGEALAVPLPDVRGGRGFWLIERLGESVLAARAVAGPGPHDWSITETSAHPVGKVGLLPLVRRLGIRGPTIRLRSGADGIVVVDVPPPAPASSGPSRSRSG